MNRPVGNMGRKLLETKGSRQGSARHGRPPAPIRSVHRALREALDEFAIGTQAVANLRFGRLASEMCDLARDRGSFGPPFEKAHCVSYDGFDERLLRSCQLDHRL